jgi:hypothetical protein
MKLNRPVQLLSICLAVMAGFPALADEPEEHRIALLITAPYSATENTMMHNDVVSMRDTLLSRGYRLDQIKPVESAHTKVLAEALKNVHELVASWKHGEVFIFYSGHGWLMPDSTDPALNLGLIGNDFELFPWKAVFSDLNVPQNLQLIVLPDC